MQGLDLRKQALMIIVAVFAIAFNPSVVQAKGGDEQSQIILLNDSAAALEDTNPELSKSLTKFADEKEKEWEYENANKGTTSTPVTGKNTARLQDQIKLIKAAALAIRPTYPLIADSLDKMAKGLNKTTEINNKQKS